MNYLIKTIQEQKEFKRLENIKCNRGPVVISGLLSVGKVSTIEAIKESFNKNILVVTYNELALERIENDLKYYSKNVYSFPKRDIVSYDFDAQSFDILVERMNTINKINSIHSKRGKKENIIVVSSIEAIMQKMISKEELFSNKLNLKVGTEYDLNDIKKKLMSLGYEKDDIVDSRGRFASHGGIIDIGIEEQKGIRLEFWGDELDSIKLFSLISQRSIENYETIEINPIREFVLDLEKENLEDLAKDIENDVDKEQIISGNYIAKVEKYFNTFYKNSSSFLDYIDDNYIIVLDDISKIKDRVTSIKKDSEAQINEQLEKNVKVIDSINNLIEFSIEDTIIKNNKLNKIYFEEDDIVKNKIKFVAENVEDENIFTLKIKDVHFYKTEKEKFIKDIKEGKEQSEKIIILSGNKNGADEVIKLLEENDLQSLYVPNLEDNISLNKNVITISDGNLSSGLLFEDEKILVITGEEFLAEKKIKKRKYTDSFKEAQKVSYQDLEPGDYVVHKNQGIGIYVGINTIKTGDIVKDYLKIKYKGEDILYVPTDSLDAVRKFIGGGEQEPKLNKLGSKEWETTKNKVKNNLRLVAKDLIELYARRSMAKGYKFSPDTEWQKEFEESFPYEETGDQLRCIDEVKHDMESEKPMDRLLCGDVGYGKTEVAIRAAFKAAMEGKQVTYLAPTTILAEQQYKEFKRRMENYALRVEVLNRFVTKKKQTEIIKKIKLGEVDIVVGTHRLLSEDIEFKNLGLLIIDEEHRFGVKAKEKIKKLKENVDVLTMTATPIPRTLHMSIVGIRDMSVIYEPPHNRKAVKTYVLEYDKEVIKEAITKELERNGQVFYLHNNTYTIARKAKELQDLVPEAKIGYATGKMSGEDIESVMEDFITKKINVIVCTTILEAGIDIPNANTIIVEDADRLGLAQLYQIRGRVGRGDRQAYSYITYKKDHNLSEVADKRLKAIKEFTEFGSGYKVALRDLEIRGAGSLLGEMQSGHMAQVGYDTYCSLLDEVIKEEQGIEVKQERDIQIDLRLSSYIPETYIEENSQKIEMYQNIALCTSEEDINDVLDELIDRYGEIPKETLNLIEIARIKIMAKEANVLKITQRENSVVFYIDKMDINARYDGKMISNLIEKYKADFRLSQGIEPYITLDTKKIKNDKDLIKFIKDFLQMVK